MTENQATKTPLMAKILILALVLINLLLLKQNFDARQLLAGKGEAVNPAVSALKEGETVTSIAGLDLNGQPGEVNYGKDGRQHLLIFFSPNCTFCVRQAPQWRDMLNKIDNTRFDVRGIVSDKEDKQAVFEHADGLGYLKTRTALPILFVNNESLARYKLTATPTTLLVGSDGKVEHVWVGKWSEAQATEVAAALN
jgi:peroxiredoxin